MTAWLLDTLLYTGLLIALVLVLRRPVGQWFGAQIAYALWALPFLRLLLPPIVLPASLAPAQEPVAAATAIDLAAIPSTVATGSVEALAAAPLAPAWARADLVAVGFSVWLGGALAFLVWRIATYRRMRAELLAGARPVGEVGMIRLVETPAISAPVAFGVCDKVVALPPLFMAQPDLVARDLAIAHELAHHRGHDLLANFAAQALLALHWCNPLAWYGWRAMRRDQEAACDARVVAGRCREERALYAALIADIAAGPRLALAAPMACPVLGEKSIIHRLKSLSASDASPRRRLLGRGLVGAAALALPMTASISYSAAGAQALQPVAPAAVPHADAAASALVTEEAGQAGATVPQAVLRDAADPSASPAAGTPVASDFAHQNAPMPPMPPSPPAQLAYGPNWDSSAFEVEMKEFERAMEVWGRDVDSWAGEWSEKWGSEHAAQARAHALASAEAARSAPEVVQSCDRRERRRTTTADGRPRIVICEREIRAQALAGARASLSGARASVAANRQLGESIRREVLRDLDSEIERIEAEN